MCDKTKDTPALYEKDHPANYRRYAVHKELQKLRKTTATASLHGEYQLTSANNKQHILGENEW